MKLLSRLYWMTSFVLLVLCVSAFVPISESAAAQDNDAGRTPSAMRTSQFVIPGPLRSFLRMAGISQKISPSEVLPLLSRNIFAQGYEGTSRQTEFLLLLSRYVVQARELTSLAANSGMLIRVTNCEDAKPLLRILGYRPRPTCGESGATLQTADAERAFLTIDSGFPLPDLEQALQSGTTFEYNYSGTSVPVLFADSDWTMASKKNNNESSRDLIDTLINDPLVARLYWAMSKLDPQTATVLDQSVGAKKLLPYGAILDFYGSRICIRDGRVVVPGGTKADDAWKDLVGASPSSAPAFVQHLLARDKGWLTAYFDVLSRVSRDRQEYFTDPQRLKTFYSALRSPDPSASATTGSFRPAPSLLLLATRLQRDANGQPLVPGNLEVWKEILHQKNESRIVREWGKKTSRLENPDQLVQVMFALARANTDDGPLQMYMAISELDSRHSAQNRLSPATVRLLARRFEEFSDQYRTFSEFPELGDESLTLFLETAQGLNSVPTNCRGNALGMFQANIGIWQILARQGQIPSAQLNESWQQVVKPFAKLKSGAQVYDAGRASLNELFRFSSGKVRPSQDEIIELLAGPAQSTADGKRMHQEVASRIRSVMDGQRLVSLDTILLVGDALNDKSRGKEPEEYAVRIAGETREFEMPRPIFTSGERTEWAPGIYNNHHTDLEMRADLVKVLKTPGSSHSQIEDARAQLASFLRDTLVGLNYAYYEPPGAQALHNNPLFVRSHDFSAETVSGIKTVWQAPQLLGQGTPAGGGAHFVGSLADLPYTLAELEQDFIAPESVQALIWKELTPGLLTGSVLPRWWDVSPTELHAVALYQRAGEELLEASAKDDGLRGKVMTILSDRVMPRQSGQLEQALRTGHVAEALPSISPADTFYLTAEFQRRYPGDDSNYGTATQELQSLTRQYPDQVSMSRLSRDFGVPHPSMAQTYGRELLNVAPMPAFSGSSSRFLAESWDSSNLYWARLVDEKGYSPVTLNRLAPELTHRMVEKIFATDFEDWPALLRAMREAGNDFRDGKLSMPASTNTARP